MFTDDISETWGSSEFQDSFIKDYFGKRKVFRWEAKDELDSADHFENSYSSKDSKGVFQSPQDEDEHEEMAIESCLSKTKLGKIRSVMENVKKKRKLSNNLSDNSIKNHKNNAYINKMEQDTFDSSSLKSKKHRKRKSKNRNKGVIEEETSLSASHHETSNQMNGTGEKKRRLSNDSAPDNYGVNFENNSDLDKMELNFSTTDSDFLKSKKKKKQKHKNKVVIDKQTSHYETLEQMDDSTDKMVIEEETDVISSHLSQKKSLFQSKLCQKLQAAKFRFLNEMLYTNTGKDALIYFQGNTEEFQDYHAGYQSQVSKWPINPVDIIIEDLRQMNKQYIIADLGCGEAKIAEAFPKRTIHSFDLIAAKDCVTSCDMANVPLPRKSVDVVVFCLSLMGTNWKDYLKEGHRLLKLGGILKIAEIESRIADLNNFIKNIEAHGFSLINKDVSHKMFVFLNFKKIKNKVKTSKIPNVTLKPCLYKKR